MIDLDQANFLEMPDDHYQGNEGEKRLKNLYKLHGPILTYDEEDVESKELLTIHARGSSRKEKIDLHQNLLVFFLHGDTIYNWTLCYTEDISTVRHTFQQMIKVTTTLSKSFSLLNDSSFFFFCADDKIETVKEIKIYSSTFEVLTRYEEFTVSHKIESFNFDQIRHMFMILSSSITQDQGITKTIYKFKLFSLKK